MDSAMFTPVQLMTPTTARRKCTIQDFTVKHRLGKGAYGDVFLTYKNSDYKAYALKQIQKRKLQRQQKEYQAMVERQLLTNLKHPGIVKLSYSFQDKQSLYFVQEFCQGGEFITFIKLNLDKLTQQAKVFYIAEIVNILQYLHGVGVTHRDLKPENLMLDKYGHLKLIDFGTAQITDCTILKPTFKQNIVKLKAKSSEKSSQKLSSEEDLSDFSQMDSPLKKRRSTFVGTCRYISPQLLEENYCPPSADLWALGCIIYQMYYLQTPFGGTHQFAVFQKIKQADYSFPKNDSITQEAIDLIKRLLVRKPEDRLGSGVSEQLSYAKLKSHPYFKSMDIDNIFKRPVPYIPNLQTVQRTEQEKKQYQESLEIFKKQTENTQMLLQQEYEKKILKSEIVEEKTFAYYNHAFIVLTQDEGIEDETGELFIVNADQAQKIKSLEFKEPQQQEKKQEERKKAKLLTQDEFLIYQKERTIHIRTNNAEQWVKKINIYCTYSG